MEEDLNISKEEYLSNCLLDHTKILNLDLGDQSKVFKYLKWRRPPMEDDLQIFKVDYLSNHLLHPTKKFNSNLDYQKSNLQILEMILFFWRGAMDISSPKNVLGVQGWKQWASSVFLLYVC